MTFDNHGYLVPADTIETDLETFEKTFVFNEHRNKIFQEYLLFLNAIQDLGINPFYQWINGSFTTMKMNPNDIDVVTFLDYKQHEIFDDALSNLKYSFRQKKVDGYFVAIFPEEHPDRSLFTSYVYDFWHNFTRDMKKEVRLKAKFKKGFIKINFDNKINNQ